MLRRRRTIKQRALIEEYTKYFVAATAIFEETMTGPGALTGRRSSIGSAAGTRNLLDLSAAGEAAAAATAAMALRYGNRRAGAAKSGALDLGTVGMTLENESFSLDNDDDNDEAAQGGIGGGGGGGIDDGSGSGGGDSGDDEPRNGRDGASSYGASGDGQPPTWSSTSSRGLRRLSSPHSSSASSHLGESGQETDSAEEGTGAFLSAGARAGEHASATASRRRRLPGSERRRRRPGADRRGREAQPPPPVSYSPTSSTVQQNIEEKLQLSKTKKGLIVTMSKRGPHKSGRQLKGRAGRSVVHSGVTVTTRGGGASGKWGYGRTTGYGSLHDDSVLRSAVPVGSSSLISVAAVGSSRESLRGGTRKKKKKKKKKSVSQRQHRWETPLLGKGSGGVGVGAVARRLAGARLLAQHSCTHFSLSNKHSLTHSFATCSIDRFGLRALALGPGPRRTGLGQASRATVAGRGRPQDSGVGRLFISTSRRVQALTSVRGEAVSVEEEKGTGVDAGSLSGANLPRHHSRPRARDEELRSQRDAVRCRGRHLREHEQRDANADQPGSSRDSSILCIRRDVRGGRCPGLAE